APPSVSERTVSTWESSVATKRGTTKADSGATSRPPNFGVDVDPETPVRPHLVFKAPRGKRVLGALVTAKTAKNRRLRPKRTTGTSDVILDEVVPSEGPLLVTLRDARYGKQTFRAEVTASEQRLSLSRPRTGTLTGHIRTTNGAPPASAVLTLIDHEGVVTEPDDFDWERDGTFRVDIVPGSYRVRAGSPGYCPSEWERLAVAVDTATSVDLVIIRAAKVSGVVLSGSSPLSSRTVDVELEAQTNDGPTTTTQKARTSGQGTYELSEVRPGWYRIRACDAVRDGPWATVQVAEGLDVQNFTLSLDGGIAEPAIVGQVVDEAGVGIPLATVFCDGRRTLTDDHGGFVLHLDPALPPPEVTFEAEGYLSKKATPSFDRTRGRQAGFSIDLEPLD
ncbi:MAG TPA: carboxypeptidase-like regulatory domain-containing protein, partial [Planctomycetota bacterium]|nr:carboxypeptidase-like regulatory domain-containing protein [Planctomycetota bacterium]